MELFSKRNSTSLFRRGFAIERRQDDDNKKFLSSELRTRICSQIEYITNSSNYLERFLLVDNKDIEKFYFNYEALSYLGKRELGYDISELFNSYHTIDYGKGNEKYNDEKLLDLIELIIIFSKNELRDVVISDFKNTFQEEDDSYIFHDFMIFKKTSSNIRSITPLIKDKLLKNRLEEYIKNTNSSNYEILARVSADILQNIFSSPVDQAKTKKYSEEICEEIAKTWTTKEKQEDLKNLLSEEVKSLKSFNNQISNIRHSDKSVIPIGTPDFYKVIAVKNMAMVELVILSLPERYILEQKPEKLKEGYLSKYKINMNTEWIIKKQEEEDDIRVENIPF